jgi:surface carbohydrate biosynthesis protein (TIGR04326 family)
MNALYIFDEASEIERLVASLDRTTKKLVLCPITTDEDFVSSIVDRLSKEEPELEVVNFTELFNKTSFSIREEYLRFICEFPNRMTVSGRNLIEYFRFPSRNFSAWWFSLLAEKNTLKTGSYSQLSRTLSILDIQEKHSCDIILCDIMDYMLYRTLRASGRNRGFQCRSLRKNVSRSPELLQALLGSSAFLVRQFIKILAIKWRMHGIPSRKEILKKSKFLPVTYFPLIDKKQLKEKRFVNRYYQPIQRALEKKYPGEFVWLAMAVNLEGFDWNSSAKLAKSIN